MKVFVIFMSIYKIFDKTLKMVLGAYSLKNVWFWRQRQLRENFTKANNFGEKAITLIGQVNAINNIYNLNNTENVKDNHHARSEKK